MRIVKNVIAILLVLAFAVGALSWVDLKFAALPEATAEEAASEGAPAPETQVLTPGKRQRDDEIIAYRDTGTVEFFYHHPEDSDPAEIRVEVLIDAGYELTGKIPVQPGQTLTSAPTRDGQGYDVFVAGIYGGRILVFDAEGKVIDRVEGLSCRLYESYSDPYDALQPQEPRELQLEEGEERRPDETGMRVDLDLYEMYTAIHGLSTQARDLDVLVYVTIDEQEYLICTIEDLPPKTMYMYLYAEKDVADRMEKGRSYYGRVVSYYSDTGELLDDIPCNFETLGG